MTGQPAPKTMDEILRVTQGRFKRSWKKYALRSENKEVLEVTRIAAPEAIVRRIG